MANKLELAILATGRIFRSTPVARFSTSERRGLCATSTLPYSIPRPAQRLNRLLGSIHPGLMSPVAPLPTPAEVIVGQSGSRYRVLETLQDKGQPWGGVYLATDDNEARVVLKEIPQDWRARNDIYSITAECRHIRLPIDAVPDRHILVFEYLEKHVLDLVKEDIPLTLIKRILHQTLQGIAGLHARGVLHNDIKPNNILVQMTTHPAGVQVDKVCITDLEDAVRLEPGRVLEGAPLGNYMWRSPEAHAEGPMELPSDIFAFGIVCIYAVTKIVIFADNNPESTEDDRVGTVIFRQMSYFADEDGIDGLLQYLGEDNPMREVFEAIEDACHDVDKEPFARWQLPGLDDDFKDLVMRLTKLDPRKRITAQEGLSHRWFGDI